jgi:pimeloyl-ACP methyl ester carboxylesterase
LKKTLCKTLDQVQEACIFSARLHAIGDRVVCSVQGLSSANGNVMVQLNGAWHSDPQARAAGLTARVAGAGPGVVLVHGSLGDYRQWEPFVDALPGRYAVVAVSRRWHWPHPASPAGVPYTYEAHRDDLLQYLRGRGGRVHLVGHSYGAGIVLLAALAEPSLIRTLVLIEPAFNSLLPDAAPGLDEEMASRSSMLADVRSLAQRGDAAAAGRRLIDWVQGGEGGFAGLPEWVQTALLDNAITAGPTVGYAPPEVTCGQLQDLRVPTLVVTGERTRRYYRLIAERVACCVPGAVAATLSDAAHMTIVERPAQAADLVGSFLAEREATDHEPQRHRGTEI